MKRRKRKQGRFLDGKTESKKKERFIQTDGKKSKEGICFYILNNYNRLIVIRFSLTPDSASGFSSFPFLPLPAGSAC
jgi:hypothetical protein